MNTTTLLIELWIEARTRLGNQLKNIQATDLSKKLPDCPNSAGFLLRHIADVELLFAKNIFGQDDLKISAKTVIVGHDTGEWTNLIELIDYQQFAFESLHASLLIQTGNDWLSSITTKEFGTKTKAEAFGRIISHTAYHAGQLAITLKYGV